MRNPLILLAFLTACDGTEAGGDAGPGGCTQSDLIAQCPLGSNPLIGAQAEAACEGAVGGVVQDAQGQATGQCYGVGSCRVVCQFAVPCRCGVASVGREGVVCASCDDAASCGNGVCEGGESPQSCGVDCGPVCNAGERRCDGELLQECNLQGRFDTLPCPQGEVCDFVDGSPRCVRDPGIIEGQDGGVGDGGPGPDDGRIIPGDGTWPELTPVPGPDFPRTLDLHEVVVPLVAGNVQNSPTGLTQAMTQAGSRNLWQWRLPPDADVFEGLGGTGRIRVDLEGEVALHPPPAYPPADRDAFCAATARCLPEVPGVCEALWSQWSQQPAEAIACVVALSTERCGLLQQLEVDPACRPSPVFPYPADQALDANEKLLVGSRLLGVDLQRTAMVAVDLDTETTRQHDPVGGFMLTNDRNVIALSADGRTAATVGYQANDQVIVIWEVGGARRAVLPRSVGSYNKLALSPDGQVLALVETSSGDPTTDGVVSLWNLAEERRIFSIRPPPNHGYPGLRVLAFSPDARHLVMDILGQTAVEVWQLGPEPEVIQVLSLDNEPISLSALAPDGVTLALGGLHTRRVSLWDIRTGQRWRTLDPAGSDLREVHFAADGRRLLVLFQDNQLAYHFRLFQP